MRFVPVPEGGTLSQGNELYDLLGNVLNRPVAHVDDWPLLTIAGQPSAVSQLLINCLQVSVSFNVRITHLPYAVYSPALKQECIYDEAEHFLGQAIKQCGKLCPSNHGNIRNLPAHIAQIHGEGCFANT